MINSIFGFDQEKVTKLRRISKTRKYTSKVDMLALAVLYIILTKYKEGDYDADGYIKFQYKDMKAIMPVLEISVSALNLRLCVLYDFGLLNFYFPKTTSHLYTVYVKPEKIVYDLLQVD